MTTNKRRKVTKYRGSKTHGGGSKKKRRGSGSRGGFGMAGTGKRAGHKQGAILKLYGHAYFGRHGFHRPPAARREENAINIRDLPNQDEVNLKEMGYTKLLSIGSPRRKYKIMVDLCSAKAKEKIEKAGGQVVTQEHDSI